ncbi:SPCC736.13 [Symbiodinium sp. CCMP2592]|nr:SPCC736.13 [Symbiodinium sp. CCMP2592]
MTLLAFAIPASIAAVGQVLLAWDWRIWLVIFIVGSVVLQHKGPVSAEEQASKVAKAAKRHQDAGDFQVAYLLLTRGLRLLGVFDNGTDTQKTGPTALELRRRRAELLLARGFTGPCMQEALSFSGPAAGLLRARALAKQGKWTEALEAMKEPGVRDYARDNYSDKFSLLVEVGARHMAGQIDVPMLMRAAIANNHYEIPGEAGPLRYQSPKLTREWIPGRGRGMIASEDIAAGELLICERPMDLVRPGDSDWAYGANLEEVLTRRLTARCLHEAQLMEDVCTLFDGQDPAGPGWVPHSWQTEDFAVPMPRGAGTPVLEYRLGRIVKHNAHRWPGCHPQTLTPMPGLGLWLVPPMVNHALESDSRPNTAHVFIGDVMVFRAIAPIKKGQEVLDRYSTPLADRFQWTLHTLAAHEMRDATYEAAAARWEEPPLLADGTSSELALSKSRKIMLESLRRMESKEPGNRGLDAVSRDEYQELKDSYFAAAAETRKELQEGRLEELPLAPPEVRCLNLLCPLSFHFEGRSSCLELRAELARRVSLARPFHFGEVKLWAELFERFKKMEEAGATFSAEETTLRAEVDRELARCAEFWQGVGTLPASGSEGHQLKEEFALWVKGSEGFHLMWFSDFPLSKFLSGPPTS